MGLNSKSMVRNAKTIVQGKVKTANPCPAAVGQSSVWRPVRDRKQDQVRVLRNRGNQKYVSQENLGSKSAPKLVCAKSSKVNIGKHQNPENIGLKKEMKSVMHQLQKKITSW